MIEFSESERVAKQRKMSNGHTEKRIAKFNLNRSVKRVNITSDKFSQITLKCKQIFL